MNCINHPELAAVAYCRTCGKALCDTCKKTAQGIVYCEEHAPEAAASYVAPVAPGAPVGAGVSPGLAFILGLIIVFLLMFAVMKFALVASWYMHLRTDKPIFRNFFVLGIVAAIVLYLIVLTTLHVFGG